ncbi:carboxypeptidase regulatory-like domain-containing protein [Plantactinospora sonchi]|uniref:Carboxypeptidase regulatory-like domain-containing protein n=1 Tax=Plantactinospora sonchi TaxID=1544735 RepID=A0ABU7S479_9ACTN
MASILVGIVVGGTLLVPAFPAVADPVRTEDPSACVDEQADAAAAKRVVAACGRRVEILSERTEYSQTFLNVDGSRTMEQGIEPVRVRKGSSWVPVDTTLKPSPEGITPKASVLPVVISAGGSGPLARLRDGDRELAVSWPEPLPAPELRGSTATYHNVLPDVDLQVTAHALGFSEVLVVRSRAAAANPKVAELRFKMSTKNVTVGVADGGGLAARDASGRIVFAAPAPLMWDSSTTDASTPSGDPAAKGTDEPKETRKRAPSQESQVVPEAALPVEEVRRAVMPVHVEGDEMVLRPDRRMLTDPRVELPIMIDPGFTGNVDGNAWTSVWSKHKSSSFWKDASALQEGPTFGSAGAGRTEDCSGCADHIVRSLFRMKTDEVKGAHIQSAEFRIEQKHAWTCNPKSNAKLWLTGSISLSTTWNKQPTWDSSYTAQTAANRKVGSAHGCLGAGTIEFNVKSMVEKAAKNKWNTLTVGLRAIDEGTLNQWKRFNHSSPKLAITFNNSPNALTNLNSDGKGCATGLSRPYVLTTTPTLSAGQSDSNEGQQSLTTSFYWWPEGGSRNETNKVSKSEGNPSPVATAIPAGKLVDGGTYVWQARTYDGSHYGDWSGKCEFTVDATPPPTPGSVTSADYPEDGPARGGVGIAGVFEIAPPATRPKEVKEYAWTLDSGVLAAAETIPARTTDYGATLTIRPTHDGTNTLRVWAKDRAGRFSETPEPYTFTVRAGMGPAAQWTFDEANGDATDVSKHANTATLSGSGATRVTGRGGVGKALSLNGGFASTAGPVQHPHPDTGEMLPVRTDSSFTVTARLRLPVVPTANKAALAADGVRSAPFWLGYEIRSGRWAIRMHETDVDGPATQTVTSSAAPVANRWTHLAATYDGGTKTIRLYVDGVLQSGTATLTTGFNATGPIRIGAMKYAGELGHRWPGDIDDVRIYDYIESPAKIAELAVPLPPTVTFPTGTEATAGGQLTAVLDGGGDTNVTKFRYSVDNTGLGTEVAATSPGGTATVTINVGGTIGERLLHVVAVDDGNRASGLARGPFNVVAAASLSGVVFDAMTFEPVAGATVRLEPGGLQTVTGDGGRYSFIGFQPGTYTVSASVGGRCGLSGSATLDVSDAAASFDLYLFPYTDGLGYTCAERSSPFTAAGTVVPLTGDNAVHEVGLPFAFPFYGQAYRIAWVDTNGVLSFDDPGGSHPYTGGQLPAPANPNAIVAPFWDDLVVDASASVRTTTTGSGEDERFVIEWRNVHRKASTSQRLSFEVILAPDGTVTTNYDQLDNDAERGAQAAVGIEGPAGEDGLQYSVNQPVLASGRAISFDHPEEESPIDVYDLSGTLVDAAGTTVVGATVSLDPGGLTATTGAGGVWRFDGLVADSYSVTSRTTGRCPQMVEVQVELAADTVRDLRYGPDYGGLGYACSTSTGGYISASTQLALTGDASIATVTFPFPVTMHGGTHSSATVSTEGVVIFGPSPSAGSLWNNRAMPNMTAPNAIVAPFWDDLFVDTEATMWTQTVGTAPNRSFVIEWRNARLFDFPDDRVSFEVVFHEDGRIAFHYGTLDSTWEQGGAATIGIENVSGTVAAQYSSHTAALTSNRSITYTPAPKGTVSGTVTTAVTSNPMAGATVTLNPGGRTATTGADGSYQFTNLPVGEYTVAASTGDNRCPGQYATQTINHAGGTSDVDLSVMVDGDEGGYKCTTATQAFIPGDIVEGWSGANVWQKNPPFPIKLYGQSYTSAWISSSGLMTFRDPAYFGWLAQFSSPIPSASASGVPNAAVYVHWDNWTLDSQARIATRTSGTAPNRQWVVEWRNVRLADDASARATFEVIYHENGQITFAYADISPTIAKERGSNATVGIENGAGTIAFQYLHREERLSSGQGITFRPSQPGPGSITGTVTCQGTPTSGATVAVAGLSATTAADGTYRIDSIPAGTYAVITTTPTGTCKGSAVRQATVGTNTEHAVDVGNTATPANAGYTIVEQSVTYTPANSTVLPLTGDDAYTQTSLPFPISLYGQSYTTGWIDTNGLVTFINPGEPSPDAWPIPSADSPQEPNAAVYPFWHDWVVDTNASVRTTTRGTAPNREYVVEWRNVHSFEDPLTRITFQAIFHEVGGYSFAYTDHDDTFLERGGGATIGIENADGTRALPYTYRQPVLRPGLGLRITPPSP